MSAILIFDFLKREQLRFSAVNYLNYTKKTQFCLWQLHFPPNKGKQEQAMDPFHTPLPQSYTEFPIVFLVGL